MPTNGIAPLIAAVDEDFMRLALIEARHAAAMGEAPIGAVLTRAGEVLAAAHNLRERHADPTAHAEMLVITAAARRLRSWRLLDCTLYVTLEPCPMCAGAIVQARIPRLVFGAWDRKAGACRSLYAITSDDRLNHRAEVVEGVLAVECGAALTAFFATQRAMGKK